MNVHTHVDTQPCEVVVAGRVVVLLDPLLCMSRRMSIYISIRISIHISIHLSVHISVHMSAHTSIHISVLHR